MCINSARVLVAFASTTLCSLAVAQTGFTYQGELRQSGQPANGGFDVEFRLFDAVSGGNQVGPTICRDALSVANGKFTTVLDFGSQFPGDSRWLQVSVRADAGGTCGGPGQVTLTPRQALTATPYATSAKQLQLPFSGFALINGTAFTAESAFGTGITGNGGTIGVHGIAQNGAAIHGTGAQVGLAGLFDGTVRLQSHFGPFSSTFAVGPGSMMCALSESGSAFAFGVGGVTSFSEVARLSMDGRFAIGTNAPTAKIQVVGDGSTTTFDADGRLLVTGNGFVGVNRTGRVSGAEYFGIRAPVNAGYGGMYISVDGNTGQPFYGYSTPTWTAWTYLNGGDNTWRLFNGGDRLIVTNGGNVGIGAVPSAEILNVGGNIRCVQLIQTSSRRFKDDVCEVTGALDTISGLRAYQYRWNDEAPESVRGKADIGLIAEEVADALPEAVSLDEHGVAQGVDYSRVAALSLAAIRELKAQNEKLLARIEELERRVK